MRKKVRAGISCQYILVAVVLLVNSPAFSIGLSKPSALGAAVLGLNYWAFVIIGATLGIAIIAITKTFLLKKEFEGFRKEQQNQIVARINNSEKPNAEALAKSRFLSNMSHEIRTRMNSITGFCDLVSDSQISPQLRSYIRKIRSSSNSLLRLMNDILDFSKMEAGNLEVDFVRCDLKQLTTNIAAYTKEEAEEKGLNFELKQKGQVPVSILTDPFRFNQCLINISKNAVKFTDKGFITMTISSFECDDKQYVEFQIKDTGIGIDKNLIDNIFEPFSQASSIIAQKYGGPGLGLCITAKLTNLLGGALECSTEQGKGSIFTITLPTKIPSENNANISDNDIERSFKIDESNREIRFNGKVLVAEDSLTNQLLVKIYLEKMGIDVDIVENGELAVEKAKDNSYDLILMDMLMPVMDGYQATAKLKAQGCTTPIVALTANAMKGDLEKCLEAGCNEYVSKPINRNMLTKVLQRYMPLAYGKDKHNSAQGYHKSLLLKKIKEACGDEEAANLAVAAFMKDAPLCIRSIEKALDQENFNDISLYANRLKSAATHILAEKLAEKAQELENSARDGKLIACQEVYSQAKEQFDTTSEYL